MSDDEKKNLPATRGKGAIAKTRAPKSAFLAQVRAAKAKPPAGIRSPLRGDPSLIAAALEPRATRPRLVFAIDATASREPAWQAAKATTDALFEALPGQLDVALAVHGGSRVKLFTDFVSEPSALRDKASSVRCEAGETRLLDIMERCRALESLKVLVYIGDVFEESLSEAEHLAAALRLRGTRVIVLHDQAVFAPVEEDVVTHPFHVIAKLTGGAVLPFEASAIATLREMLEAIATLAVGGVKLLEARQNTLPAATLLLKQLPTPDER